MDELIDLLRRGGQRGVSLELKLDHGDLGRCVELGALHREGDVTPPPLVQTLSRNEPVQVWVCSERIARSGDEQVRQGDASSAVALEKLEQFLGAQLGVQIDGGLGARPHDESHQPPVGVNLGDQVTVRATQLTAQQRPQGGERSD